MKQIFCWVLLWFAIAAQTLTKPSSEIGTDEFGSGMIEQNDRETVREISDGIPSIKEALTATSLNESINNNTKETDHEPYSNEVIQNSTEAVNGFRATNGNTSETGILSNYTVFQNNTDEALLEFSKRLLQQFRSNPSYSYPSGLSCTTCTIFIDVLREFWNGPGITRLLAKHFSISACISLRIQHPDVCIGIIREYEKEFYYIFGNGRLSSHQICSAVLDKRCGKETILDKPWSVTFPDIQKPTVKEQSPIKSDSPVMKVLHLTDLHIDLHYKENTSRLCGEALCCRENNGPGDAGYWGSYGCDIPLRTLESALKHIKDHHSDISYIIMTGDIPPHDVWLETKSSQLEVMQRAFATIKEYFPQKKVFVAVGNHDTHPTNSFPPASVSAEYSIQWLLDSYAEMWSAWLPNTSLHTVRKGGYFTALLSSGFRIVSINNNYCNKLNWWLVLNNTDPTGELQWLIQVLQSAEDKGEKVHIIAHIPTGNNLCYKHWSANYYEIINRYENTVTAQFCGHTHQDHFEIFYDLKNHTRPHNVMYVGPSLTTNTAYEPAYRIYEVEGNYEQSSRRVLNHKTYKLNLLKSNKDRKAYWELEYSAKEEYNMKSLQPANWDNLVARMKNNNDLFQTFYKFKYRNPNLALCDNNCKSREICALKSARSYDNTFCETTDDQVTF